MIEITYLLIFMIRRSQFRGPVQNRQEATPTKKDDDDEDNWELPEGGIPY